MWQQPLLRILRVLCLSSTEFVSQRFGEIWKSFQRRRTGKFQLWFATGGKKQPAAGSLQIHFCQQSLWHFVTALVFLIEYNKICSIQQEVTLIINFLTNVSTTTDLRKWLFLAFRLIVSADQRSNGLENFYSVALVLVLVFLYPRALPDIGLPILAHLFSYRESSHSAQTYVTK